MTISEERRLVTVLFVDMVGFTGRTESSDPEVVRDIQRTYFETVAAEIERYGGTVEKYIGDAVMAIFGAPRAHGDDPERALRAALGIRDAIRSATASSRSGSASTPERWSAARRRVRTRPSTPSPATR